LDTEFVNAYIIKQKNWIEDLLAKHIILEVRVQIAEAKANQLSEQVALLNSKLEKQIVKKKSDNSESNF
jgi:hypothetical protein